MIFLVLNEDLCDPFQNSWLKIVIPNHQNTQVFQPPKRVLVEREIC
jgi:hypothetical protein